MQKTASNTLCPIFTRLRTAPQDGKVIAGSGHKRSIDDINRIISTYGGKESGWVKKTTENLNQRELVNKAHNIEIHWYENLENGHKIEPKVKKVNKK